MDTAGNDDYGVLIDNWIQDGDGFLLVYAINDNNGYRVVESKRSRIQKVKEQLDVPMLLVATKCDLEDERCIPKDQGEERAQNWKIPFYETSSKVLNHPFSNTTRKKLTMKKFSMK